MLAHDQHHNWIDAAGLGSLIAWMLGWVPQATIFLTFIIAMLRLYQIVQQIRKGK